MAPSSVLLWWYPLEQKINLALIHAWHKWRAMERILQSFRSWSVVLPLFFRTSSVAVLTGVAFITCALSFRWSIKNKKTGGIIALRFSFWYSSWKSLMLSAWMIIERWNAWQKTVQRLWDMKGALCVCRMWTTFYLILFSSPEIGGVSQMDRSYCNPMGHSSVRYYC